MSKGHIRQRSANSWELKFDAGRSAATGKRVTKHVTVRGSKRDAQRELRRLLSQVDEGTYSDPGKLTLGAYLDQWLSGHRATISGRTAERYEEHIEQHIKPAIGGLALGKVTTLDINAFYATKLASGRLDGNGGLSARTVHHFDRLLHLALEDAVRSRLIVFNPVTHAKRPKVPKKTPCTPTDEELSTLLAMSAERPLYVPLVLILTTGIRRGELLALRWRNVDLEGSRLQIVEAVEETKTGLRLKEPKTQAGRRRVDLPAFAVEALRKHQLQQKKEHLALGLRWTVDALLFPSMNGGLQRPRNFTKSVARLAARAGVKFSPHLGRHDHFTRLLAAGVHPKVAQIRAGHSSVAVTMDVYSHAIDALQKDAVERTENIFVEIRKVAGGNPVAKPISSRRAKT